MRIKMGQTENEGEDGDKQKIMKKMGMDRL